MSKRNINIELIRIISMLMIVFHHFTIHTNWNYPKEIGLRNYFILCLGNFGKIGVILFILISGYFFYKQNFSLKKLLHLNNNITFYTVTFFLISLLWSAFEFKKMITSVFPVIFDQYWFVTGYVILLLFQPLLKNYLNLTDRENKLKLLIIIIFFFYGPRLFGFIFQIEKHFKPSVYFLFIIIALIGDLIREYQKELQTIYFRYILMASLFSLSLLQFRPFIILLLDKLNWEYPDFFINGTESLNALLFSFCLFNLILRLSIDKRYNALILYISSVTFEVYLIHDNPLIRSMLWNSIFQSGKFYWSSWLFLIVIIVPLIVFIACVLIAKLKNFISSKIKYCYK